MHTDPESGLTHREAIIKLKAEGYNESPNQKGRTIFTLVKEIITEPMILLLLVGSVVYFFIGEPKDASVLSSMILVIIGITLVQQRKTERALEALKDISSPKTLVMREGTELQIPTREVVSGDIILLREGDRVSADAVVLESTNITADESLLTGESVPVTKVVYRGEGTYEKPGGNDQPFVYSGTLIVRGHGKALVCATGVKSEIGKIGRSLLTIVEENTNLQNEIMRLVTLFAAVAFFICTLVIVGLGLMHGKWLDGLLSGITLSMTLLPEEFPVVLTIFMTIGALRMSRKNVLTRNTRVIETLGAANVLCVDKTGTLTENKMKLHEVVIKRNFFTFSRYAKTAPKEYELLLKTSFLASQPNGYDPLEKAIEARMTKMQIARGTLVKEYPFSADLMATTYAWQQSDKANTITVAAKGAPEHIFKLCNLPKDDCSFWLEKVRVMAEQGQRVLAVAHASTTEDKMGNHPNDFDFSLIGLLGFIDPIKPTVIKAVQQCHQAGLRLVMITGDYPGTAMYVARQTGIVPQDSPVTYLTGNDIERMPIKELLEKIKTAHVFCRIVPSQKLRIVELLKKAGNTVAMTGDGINDAPALKSAHIGIAMGKRGTDVARESSDLIILDDNFISIVTAIKMGRRIYNNIKKALSYVVAMHIPIAGLALLPIAFGAPPVLLPIHVAFLELIIDPACTTVFESEKENDKLMKKPPRPQHDALFNLRTISFSLIQGISALASVYFVYWLSANVYSLPESGVRTATFISLVIANLSLISTNRSWSKTIVELFRSPNKAYWIVITTTLVGLTFIVLREEARNFFHFGWIPLPLFVLSITIGFVNVWWFELRKLLIRAYPNIFFH